MQFRQKGWKFWMEVISFFGLKKENFLNKSKQECSNWNLEKIYGNKFSLVGSEYGIFCFRFHSNFGV